jgi:predicted AlkP superfamily pyrophosphatase or phosphodiesterase
VAGDSLKLFPGRRALRIYRGVALLLLLAGCGGSAAAPTAAPVPTPVPSPTTPKVVIFSIDGLRPDALLQAAPVLSGLAISGASTWRAQTILPSTTLPSHASMLSGYSPSVHGITWDEFRPEKGLIPVPTLFSVARAAGLRTVLVAGKEKFRQLDLPGSVERFDLCAGNDEEVATRALAEVQAGFDLMFVHMPQTDLTGHAKGWMSPAYLDAVAGADRAVARVVEILPAGTTVIITADHGGHEWTHGTNMGVDLTIPWIMFGPHVLSRTLTTRVQTVDTAATAAFVLGISLSPAATGRPVMEAFDNAAATAVRPAPLRAGR